MRASLTTVQYATNDLEAGVITRTGRTRRDAAEIRVLRSIEHHVIRHLPARLGPRYTKP